MRRLLLNKMWMLFNLSGFIILFASVASGQALTLTQVGITGISQPMQITNAGDGSNRLFVVQRAGTIKAFAQDYTFIGDFLTVTGISTGGEGGLLSLVFHPDYVNNGLLYVYFTNSAGDLQMDRYRVSDNPNVVDVDSRVNMIIIPHPVNSNHNGGELNFGQDGMLYLSTGDGGGGGDPNNNSQNTSSLLGKLLRFNVTTGDSPPYYNIPSDNPFGNEIYAYGLRNPFRWSFDPLNGDIWIGDVGQGRWEEINHVPLASLNRTNFGWRCYEGHETYNFNGCDAGTSYTFPVFVYPTTGGAAVTGGVVYRGMEYPSLIGSYVAADYITGNFYKITPLPGGSYNTEQFNSLMNGISDFGVGEDQTIYVTRLTTSAVFKLGTDEPLPVTVLSFNGNYTGQSVQLNWHITKAVEIQSYIIEKSSDGIHYTAIGEMPQSKSETYTYTDHRPHPDINYYRLRIIESNGLYFYSEIVRVVASSQPTVTIYPSVFKCASPIMVSAEQKGVLEIFDGRGAKVLSTTLDAGHQKTLEINTCLPGIYLVRFKSGSINYLQKIISSE